MRFPTTTSWGSSKGFSTGRLPGGAGESGPGVDSDSARYHLGWVSRDPRQMEKVLHSGGGVPLTRSQIGGDSESGVFKSGVKEDRCKSPTAI